MNNVTTNGVGNVRGFCSTRLFIDTLDPWYRTFAPFANQSFAGEILFFNFCTAFDTILDGVFAMI